MPAKHTDSVCFVIPAYNEGRSVGRVVERVLDLFPGAPVAVINDGSADNTATIARLAGAFVIDLPFNSGYGVALHTGLIWAHRQSPDFVVALDSDGQHDPSEVPKLMGPVLAGTADLAIGSRYLPESRCYRVPFSRRLGSLFFARLLSFLARTRISDPTSGFQCLNRKALATLVHLPDFPERTPDADVLLFARKSGCVIAEVAVIMHVDQSADSMHGLWKSLFYVPQMLIALLGVMLGSDRRLPVVPTGAGRR